MIGALSPFISRIKRSYQSNDIIDRLNYQYTATIISLAAFTLAATQYVGKPIQCWVPPEFTGAWEKYTETYCFASGTYFLPIDEEIDASYSQRENIQITYYQWVPLILAFMAIFFYLPSFIWKALNFSTGKSVHFIDWFAVEF
uniref:Innexin n=1 Tax=Panagrolaimus sp. JU765 TaxID=591449 RepID=A0AC34Q881_9BILA